MSGTLEKSIFRKLRDLVRYRRFQPYQVEKAGYSRTYDFIIGDPNSENWYVPKDPESLMHDVSGTIEIGFILDNMIGSNEVVLECGAHHGWTTLQLSTAIGPDGLLIAFEPNPANCETLRRNLKLNHCENVVVESYAVSAASGITRLYQKSNGSVVPRIVPKSLFSKRWLNLIYGIRDVPTVSLDDYTRRHGLQPTLLKIDVEGLECEVLAGASRLMASTPKLVVEIHAREIALYGGSIERLFSAIDLKRYRAWIQFDPTSQPIEIDVRNPPPINDRVHLYAVPKSEL